MSTSHEKHPSLPDHKPEIHKSEEYQSEVGKLKFSQIQQSNQMTPNGPNQPGSNQLVFCYSSTKRNVVQEQIMSKSPEKHLSLYKSDHKPEIHKSEEYQYVVGKLKSSQIQQSNQTTPNEPNQPGSNQLVLCYSSKKRKRSTEEQIMCSSPEKHPSLYEHDHKSEIRKSHEYQYEATKGTTTNHIDELAAPNDQFTEEQLIRPLVELIPRRCNGWAFREASERMGAMLNSSQIKQNNQPTPNEPSQPGSNTREGKARSLWRQIKKYFTPSCKRN